MSRGTTGRVQSEHRTSPPVPRLPAVRLLASAPIFRVAEEMVKKQDAVRDLVPESELASALGTILKRLLTAIHEAADIRGHVPTATAAKLFGVKPGVLRQACAAGKIRGAHKVGGEWRIPVESLQGHTVFGMD